MNLNSDGFNVYSQINEGITYLTEDAADHTYYRGIITLSVKLEQI